MTIVQPKQSTSHEADAPDDVRVQVRLSPSLAERVDRVLAQERARMPGANLTRADVIRTLVVLALTEGGNR